jgi:hypothetical protein
MNPNTPDVDESNDRSTRARDTLGRRGFLGALGGVGLAALAGCTGSSERGTGFDANGNGEEFRDAATEYLDTATLYKAPNCNCCLEYAEYLEETTEAEINPEKVNDLAVIKEEYEVPEDVESCHTMDTESYFVEGHVPREAIGKLAVEEPDIAGIALPDMPTGSPGMPGEKDGTFTIYAVNEDGSTREFMTL